MEPSHWRPVTVTRCTSAVSKPNTLTVVLIQPTLAHDFQPRCPTAAATFASLVSFVALLAARGAIARRKPLWPQAGWKNSIHYDVPEAVGQHEPNKASLSGSNRVYSFVSTPTYSIHRPPEGTGKGVGLVICPGGGFRELWLDREGHDLALWLKPRGVTCLVLKYRTNTEQQTGKRKYAADVYETEVVADSGFLN